MADAVKSSSRDALQTLYGILDSVYAKLPPGTMVPGVRVAGGGLVQNTPSRPTARPNVRGSFTISDDSSHYEPFYLVLGEMMTVEEARFNIAKAMQLIELDIAEAQMRAAGIWEDAAGNLTGGALVDSTREAVRNMQYVAEATQTAADAAEDIRDAFREALTNFKDKWNSLFGPQASDDPIEQIKAKYQDLRDSFAELSRHDQVQFLIQHGVAGITGASTAADIAAGFETLIGPKEAEEIAKAIAETLQPIRDYFEDLRLNGSNLTTQQRYENTLADFNAAFAAGDIDRAVELARLLTGEVGIAQFGTSGQAYQDLQDFLVSTLGSLLPEGPPPDLMSRSVAFQERITIASEAMYERAHADADRIVAAIEENTALRRVEAGRVDR